MASLEGFLNVAVPVGIFIFLAAAIWYKLGIPIKSLFNSLANAMGWTKDKFSSGTVNARNYTEEIVYR